MPPSPFVLAAVLRGLLVKLRLAAMSGACSGEGKCRGEFDGG
jgi:hypothetical protein